MNNIKLLNIDQILNNILLILASLDGRVKKLEIRLQLKKQKSYLKSVDDLKIEKQPTIKDSIEESQLENTLALIQESIDKLGSRIESLEENLK